MERLKALNAFLSKKAKALAAEQEAARASCQPGFSCKRASRTTAAMNRLVRREFADAPGIAPGRGADEDAAADDDDAAFDDADRPADDAAVVDDSRSSFGEGG